MNKKYVLMILIIVILILIIGFLIYSPNFINQSKTINVGNSNFTMPEGYHMGEKNKFGAVSITNGSNSIFLLENEGTDVQGYIHSYEKILMGKNETMNVTIFNIDNMEIYKAISLNNTNNIHYFFIKNNKTYDIYTWDGNSNMDSTVIKLIGSS